MIVVFVSDVLLWTIETKALPVTQVVAVVADYSVYEVNQIKEDSCLLVLRSGDDAASLYMSDTKEAH